MPMPSSIAAARVWLDAHDVSDRAELSVLAPSELSAAIEQTQSLTRRYARRQVGWFRRYDAHWLDYDDPGRHATALRLAMGED